MPSGALQDFEAIVIGAGPGGSTAAAELARSGMRVLLVERGACEDRAIYVNGTRARPPRTLPSPRERVILRPGPADFEPGRHHGDRLPRHLWEWPIAYEAMRPYFDRAEDLLDVAGDARSQPPHLGRRHRPYPRPAARCEPIEERLVAVWRTHGLEPFRIPLAVEAGPACAPQDVSVREGCEAERFEVVGGKVCGVWLRDRATGRRDLLRAGVYLIGAGAIGTPVLLLRSGLEGRSNQVGRNHMCHLDGAALGLFARAMAAAPGGSQQIGLSDFRLGTPSFPHKLGFAHVVPFAERRRFLEDAMLPIPAPLVRMLHERALLLVGSIEDLPQPRNRVSLGSGGTIRLERRFHAYDLSRARQQLRELRRLLRLAGAAVRLGRVGTAASAHAPHQTGTARFGRDPRTSVIDAQCRLHGQEDVYVVDGSFLPTSLGIAPTLTIVANALRVADVVAKDRARGTALARPYSRV